MLNELTALLGQRFNGEIFCLTDFDRSHDRPKVAQGGNRCQGLFLDFLAGCGKAGWSAQEIAPATYWRNVKGFRIIPMVIGRGGTNITINTENRAVFQIRKLPCYDCSVNDLRSAEASTSECDPMAGGESMLRYGGFRLGRSSRSAFGLFYSMLKNPNIKIALKRSFKLSREILLHRTTATPKFMDLQGGKCYAVAFGLWYKLPISASNAVSAVSLGY